MRWLLFNLCYLECQQLVLMFNSLIFKYHWKACVAKVIWNPKGTNLGLNLHVVIILFKVNRKLLNTGSKFPNHSLALTLAWLSINRLCDQVQLEAWCCELQSKLNLVKDTVLVCWVFFILQSCFVYLFESGDLRLWLFVKISDLRIVLNRFIPTVYVFL